MFLAPPQGKKRQLDLVARLWLRPGVPPPREDVTELAEPLHVVSACQRRQAVRLLQERFGVSQRRACRVLGQHRSTQRQRIKAAKEEEGRLVARMLELVKRHPRNGYRRIWALLQREGWRVNRQRVYRLWRARGLKVPSKQRQKRRLGSSANSCVRRPGCR